MNALIDILAHPGAVAHHHSHTAGDPLGIAIAVVLLVALAVVSAVTVARVERAGDATD